MLKISFEDHQAKGNKPLEDLRDRGGQIYL